ncbi:MAG TPA: tRNA (N(6)-L-threonylcarbamoyladenosine(37)-C(2))-methylthiotransferase MtaB, partial [Clostridiales bacterium]|nr:tRNA (N(6)-L-threonylcarbamoyladenosine(37)-C(2))-methylthiotransferase MtaB [Clostridiales bacterium]
ADIHYFSYSQRKGTFGARLKPLPDEVKKQRLARLMELKAKLKGEF